MSLIRGTGLSGFPELVAELGGKPDELLSAAGIPRAAVGDQDAFISYRNGVRALEAAATATGTPDLGRRLALRQGVEILGPVGVAVRTAPTVGAAFQALDQYLSVYSPAISAHIDLQPDGRFARFEFRILLDRLGPHRQAEELALGVGMQIFRLVAGQDFRPVLVELPHEPLTSTDEYERYFGCPVNYSKDHATIIVRRSDLDRRVDSDNAVHEVVREYLTSIASPAEGQFIEGIRLMIRRMLPTGGLEIGLVAMQLDMHPRTLQRQLAAEGSSFANLVDGVRRDQMEHYLRDTEIPLSQIAGILGYSEQSVLTRSCRRWCGISPTVYRRTSRLQAAVPTRSSAGA
ncbi:AraC family transcriptional regulator [Aeromicrobium sp.]|uniref:AraC family transcriptional regulator n=1 Tax=Aeromicrobium sp. TaxID=1871063 RepID=UPI002FC66EC9